MSYNKIVYDPSWSKNQRDAYDLLISKYGNIKKSLMGYFDSYISYTFNHDVMAQSEKDHFFFYSHNMRRYQKTTAYVDLVLDVSHKYSQNVIHLKDTSDGLWHIVFIEDKNGNPLQFLLQKDEDKRSLWTGDPVQPYAIRKNGKLDAYSFSKELVLHTDEDVQKVCVVTFFTKSNEERHVFQNPVEITVNHYSR